MSSGTAPFGESHHSRCVADRDGFLQAVAKSTTVARSRQPQSGDDLQDRHVPHAVVAGAVITGHTCTVQHHRDTRVVQGSIHEELVERAVEEGRVHGDHRVQAAHRHSHRGGDGVLLGDPDVENPPGNCCFIGASPVGPSMAAVMATTSGRAAATLHISSENTEVHVAADLAVDLPVAGSITPTPWKRSASSCSAGG